MLNKNNPQFLFEDIYSNFSPKHMLEENSKSSKDFKYDFRNSYPAPDLLPVSNVLKSLEKELKIVGVSKNLYPDPQGYLPFRELISETLKTKRKMNISPDNILLTDGSGQGIHLVVEALVNPGDAVIVDDFVYGGTLWSLRRFHSNIYGVPSDQYGMLPEKLTETIENIISKKQICKLMYLIPTFQNPQGTTMDIQRRQEILSIAQKYEIPIIEDDGVANMRFEGEHLPSIQSFDDSGISMFVGSYSKMVIPGFRLGYIVAPDNILKMIKIIKGSRGINKLSAFGVYRFAIDFLKDHLETLNLQLKSRRNTILNTLKSHFEDNTLAKWSTPAGGLYIWLQVNPEINLKEIRDKLNKFEVSYDLGTDFSPDGSEKNSYARLCFSGNSNQEIKTGISILSNAIKTNK